MFIGRTQVNIGVAALVALVCLVFDTRLAWHFAHNVKTPLFGDFFGMWSYGRFIMEGHARSLYDGGAVHAFQERLSSRFRGELPFFYPPSMMFLVAPLGLVGQVGAYVIWQLGGLVAFMFAAFWRVRRPGAAILFLVLPGTVFALSFGQTGFIVGALLLGGLRLVPARPLLGGALLGLLTVKPQLAVLLPVALLAARQWRAMAAAWAAAAMIACACVLVFGFAAWVDWVHSLAAAEAQWHVEELGPAHLREHAHFAATVTVALAVLHVSWAVIRPVQILAAMFSAAMVWRACRNGLDGSAVLVVAAASFLASPHGFLYDMPALLGATVLLLFERRFDQVQLVAALLLVVLPVAANVNVLPFAGPPLMALLVISLAEQRIAGVAGWRIPRSRKRQGLAEVAFTGR